MSDRNAQIEALVPAVWVEAAIKGLRAVGLKETAITFTADGVIVIETTTGQTFRFEGNPWMRLDQPKSGGRESRVYVIASSSGHVKIGIAVDVKARLRGLQGAHAEALSVLTDFPGGRPLEQQLHKALAKLRMKGEWFRRGPWLEALLTAVAEGQKGAECILQLPYDMTVAEAEKVGRVALAMAQVNEYRASKLGSVANLDDAASQNTIEKNPA